MTTTVTYQRRGDVAVLLLDNPPVNGLGDTVRKGVFEGIARAVADPAVRAVVLAGRGRGFSGGADVRQFNTPSATAEPMSRQVIAQIEESAKPVIAAIHGIALGGGLELALGCHYRVVTADATLGLPEVNLGLVPGGGGTQRLPRLVGVATALDMIQHARTVDGAKAVTLGLADATFDGDPVDGGVEFARTVLDAPSHPVIGRSAPAAADVDFAAARAAVSPRARNADAQRGAIDCVEHATALSLTDGLDQERAVFERLVGEPTSKALRHLFFAERKAAKAPGSGNRPIKSVAVIGAGTMGGGIAMAFANAGFPVTVFEREQAPLDRGLALIRRNYEITASKGKLSHGQITQRLALIKPTLEMSEIADADLVIEAVFEDMPVKKAVFRQLDAVCKPGAILATNTSRLDIDEIAAATSRPQDVIGLHFFSPANVMRLLEVVRGVRTADEVIDTSMRIASDIGKIPVLVKVCEGFVGNRMLTGYWREAWFLLEEGASPQQIDQAMKDFGMAMGPLAMADLAGLDINWAARKRLAPTRPEHLRYSAVPDRICEQGRFGQKTNAGFYRYEPGDRTPIPDPAVEEVVERCAREAGLQRREISTEEIVDRCVLALINEGARIVDEGIAQRASDVDVVYVHGYGFPARRGGPMHHAQTIGLDTTLAKIKALHAAHGELWTPAPLLERAVAEGRTGL
ncbi:3-hydroxyacyl-CoA dehydrogenase NAD-binding domain-containing protein [Saccharopolyspora sp. NPDC050389]|uniref:3-hydroxyacyl-CoA dehydrogenase NAD-binding domain-containing protein n=1 Tax=Saccharopolyspora sp. NPDC050389 TaxID=3155516 RepID=UPI00340A1465